mmetsp:Transcript_14872/g.22708  ORF Transcript_14872/g.22708 Transcript_14872/m.22708 type:complete len:259 (+) Transcript_14872:2-778(+)
MNQVMKGTLSHFVSNEKVWGKFVRNRFNIKTATSRPKLHGGPTWKEAYRQMSLCNRVPKSRYTSKRNIIFAKNGGRMQGDPVSVWVLLGHTDNCETRQHTGGSTINNNSQRNRFVNLHVCLQNVKSNGIAVVDALSSTLELLDGGIGGVQGWPEIVYQGKCHVSDVDGVYILKPFEFIIVCLKFDVGEDVKETDFLARALSFRVPVTSKGNAVDEFVEKKLVRYMATATFHPESYIWHYYSELPGGCLTFNPDQLVNV